LALAMTSTIFVISNMLFGLVAGLVLAAVNLAMFSWLWFGFPAFRRAHELRSRRRVSSDERSK